MGGNEATSNHFCWAGLGWVGLGWVGLGWVGLGWVVLCCVVLCCVVLCCVVLCWWELCCVVLCCVVLCCVVLCCVDLGWVGLGPSRFPPTHTAVDDSYRYPSARVPREIYIAFYVHSLIASLRSHVACLHGELRYGALAAVPLAVVTGTSPVRPCLPFPHMLAHLLETQITQTRHKEGESSKRRPCSQLRENATSNFGNKVGTSAG